MQTIWEPKITTMGQKGSQFMDYTFGISITMNFYVTFVALPTDELNVAIRTGMDISTCMCIQVHPYVIARCE